MKFLTLIALFAFSSQGYAQANFYSAGPHSKAITQNGAEIFLTQSQEYWEREWIDAFESGDTQVWKTLKEDFLSQDRVRHLISAAFLIRYIESSPESLAKVKELLSDVKSMDVQTRLPHAMNILSIITSLDVQEVEIIEDITSFLDSSNFHEVYLTLRTLRNLRASAPELQAKVIALHNSGNANISVKRHIVLYLGSVGSDLTDESRELIKSGLTAFMHPLREAAVTSLLNLIPDDQNAGSDLEAFFKADTRFSLEQSIYKAVTTDNPQEIALAYQSSPRAFLSSTNQQVLIDYLQFLGTKVNDLEVLFAEGLVDEDKDVRVMFASLILRVASSISNSDLVEKARSVLND